MFLSTTEGFLLADLSLFLSCTEGWNNGNVKDRFANLLRKSTSPLLLMFDDVRQPAFVLSLLPDNTPHCVVMTSVCHRLWIERQSTVGKDMRFEVTPLSISMALNFFYKVFWERASSKAATHFVQTRSQKRKLISFLKEELLNNPLAIRLAAYQIASGRIDIDKLSVFEEESSSERSIFDCWAARQGHSRGFYHVSNIAMASISSNVFALMICFALSLLSAKGTPLWFIELLGYYLDLSADETKQTVLLLADVGLVTIFDSEQVVLMHQAIQCHVRWIVSKSEEDGKARDLRLSTDVRTRKVVDGLVKIFTKRTVAHLYSKTAELHKTHATFHRQQGFKSEKTRCAFLENIYNGEIASAVRCSLGSFLENASWIGLDKQRLADCLQCLALCKKNGRV